MNIALFILFANPGALCDDTLNGPIRLHHHGPIGGNAEAPSELVNCNIGVTSLVDPLHSHPHNADIRVLIGDIPYIINPNLEDDADPEPQDADSMHIIHIDSFSFFFQRDSPAQLTNLHLDNVRALDLNQTILPQQKFEIVVHNGFIVNYGPYADDLRAQLMTNVLPFMYQHRSLTSLIPSQIGDYFSFNALDIIIKFDAPRFPINNNTEQYSDSTSSINSDDMKSTTERLKSPRFEAPSNHDNIPWFVFNIPFSANIPDEAKQLEGEVIDNHLISIPWIISDLDTKCDYTTIDLSLTPCNISSSIRKSALYHSIIDTDKFVMKYKWTTPLSSDAARDTSMAASDTSMAASTMVPIVLIFMILLCIYGPDSIGNKGGGEAEGGGEEGGGEAGGENGGGEAGGGNGGGEAGGGNGGVVNINLTNINNKGNINIGNRITKKRKTFKFIDYEY